MSRSKDVEAWFARYENPMKDVVVRIREIILEADPRIGVAPARVSTRTRTPRK